MSGTVNSTAEVKEQENRTNDGQVSHANLLGETLLDQRHARESVSVTRELLLDGLHEEPWSGINKAQASDTYA